MSSARAGSHLQRGDGRQPKTVFENDGDFPLDELYKTPQPPTFMSGWSLTDDPAQSRANGCSRTPRESTRRRACHLLRGPQNSREGAARLRWLNANGETIDDRSRLTQIRRHATLTFGPQVADYPFDTHPRPDRAVFVLAPNHAGRTNVTAVP